MYFGNINVNDAEDTETALYLTIEYGKCNTAKVKEGETVAVFGLGGIGLAALIGATMA